MVNDMFTRSRLEALGMDEHQISAILEIKEDEEKARHLDNAQEKENAGVDIPINCNEVMQVTSVFDLQRYAKGTLVRFPDFAEGQPFVARVRRPSMLVLAKQGKIPNTLLASANELFSRGGSGMDRDNDNMLSDIYDICKIICVSALKEPTYQQIIDAGLELSDDQLMAVFNYTQTGIKALESFR